MPELTPIQKQVLNLFKKSPLKEKFYWTGGTLLSAVYLHHRQSHDLDFFSDAPFSHTEVIGFIRKLKNLLALPIIEEKKIFDRWEFFLHNKEKLRLEFVFYDHPRIHPHKNWHGILIDSLDDITTNKLMAFFDRNDPKDLVDLYFLLTNKNYNIGKLLKLVERKFGVKFQKNAVWSEAFKGMKNLDSLKPLLFGDVNKRQKIIREVKDYFTSRASQYLEKILE